MIGTAIGTPKIGTFAKEMCLNKTGIWTRWTITCRERAVAVHMTKLYDTAPARDLLRLFQIYFTQMAFNISDQYIINMSTGWEVSMIRFEFQLMWHTFYVLAIRTLGT